MCHDQVRLYWVGLKGLVGNHAKITQFFQRILKSCKLTGYKTRMHEMLTVDDVLRAREAKALGIALHSAFGMREPQQEKAGPDWKTDHSRIFPQNGLTYIV